MLCCYCPCVPVCFDVSSAGGAVAQALGGVLLKQLEGKGGEERRGAVGGRIGTRSSGQERFGMGQEAGRRSTAWRKPARRVGTTRLSAAASRGTTTAHWPLLAFAQLPTTGLTEWTCLAQISLLAPGSGQPGVRAAEWRGLSLEAERAPLCPSPSRSRCLPPSLSLRLHFPHPVLPFPPPPFLSPPLTPLSSEWHSAVRYLGSLILSFTTRCCSFWRLLQVKGGWRDRAWRRGGGGGGGREEGRASKAG